MNSLNNELFYFCVTTYSRSCEQSVTLLWVFYETGYHTVGPILKEKKKKKCPRLWKSFGLIIQVFSMLSFFALFILNLLLELQDSMWRSNTATKITQQSSDLNDSPSSFFIYILYFSAIEQFFDFRHVFDSFWARHASWAHIRIKSGSTKFSKFV